MGFFLLKLASVYLGQIYILPANVFEMAIFSAILYYYKLAIDKKSKSYELLSRSLAIIGFIGRATSIIPLAILWPYRLLSMKGTLLDRFKYLMLNIATVALMIITSIIYDTLYFTKFTWTALNFLEFNLLTNGADFYGVHNPLWYVTECIPYLLVGALPFFGLGLIRYVSDEINKKNDLHLIVILVLFLAILSIPAHKEDRMLMTVWPILILLTTYGFVNMKSSKFKKLLIILTLITNVALFSFMGLHHNRASFSIFGTLRAQSDNLKSVYFFTECHQTPYYSFLHKNIPMGFPDCSPQNQLSGTDSLKLFTDPKPYIQGIFENQNPSHIVILNHFLRNQTVAEFIAQNGYKQIEEQEHALFIDSPIGNIDDISYIIMEKQ